MQFHIYFLIYIFLCRFHLFAFDLASSIFLAHDVSTRNCTGKSFQVQRKKKHFNTFKRIFLQIHPTKQNEPRKMYSDQRLQQKMSSIIVRQKRKFPRYLLRFSEYISTWKYSTIYTLIQIAALETGVCVCVCVACKSAGVGRSKCTCCNSLHSIIWNVLNPETSWILKCPYANVIRNECQNIADRFPKCVSLQSMMQMFLLLIQ